MNGPGRACALMEQSRTPARISVPGSRTGTGHVETARTGRVTCALTFSQVPHWLIAASTP